MRLMRDPTEKEIGEYILEHLWPLPEHLQGQDDIAEDVAHLWYIHLKDDFFRVKAIVRQRRQMWDFWQTIKGKEVEENV